MIEYRQFPHPDPVFQEAVRLRDRILRAPLGLAFSDEELEAEAADFHLGAFDSEYDRLVGCLVLSPLENGDLKMRQVAVDESCRGQGIGKALVRFAEGFARERNYPAIVMNAREPVVPFYEALGYEVEGAAFIEVTIPHRRLAKRLASA